MTAVRAIYNLLDLFGDLGGVLEIFIAIFAIFVEPISEHSFILTFLGRLFFARTDDATLFPKSVFTKSCQVGVEECNTSINKLKRKNSSIKKCDSIKAEEQRHYVINLSFC